MLLPEDTDARQNFATWELAQMERNPQWLQSVMRKNEAHFSQEGAVNMQNSCIWATQTLMSTTGAPALLCDCLVGPIFF